MNWNMKKYLPSAASCQSYFQVSYSTFVLCQYWHCDSSQRMLANTDFKMVSPGFGFAKAVL